MSSAISITLDADCPVTLDQFEEFCAQHSIRYSPQTVGRNVFYGGDVEITFGEAIWGDLPTLANGRFDFDSARPHESAEQVSFSTYFMGSGCPDVVRLALAFWQKVGGALDAAPELREIMCRSLLAEQPLKTITASADR